MKLNENKETSYIKIQLYLTLKKEKNHASQIEWYILQSWDLVIITWQCENTHTLFRKGFAARTKVS